MSDLYLRKVTGHPQAVDNYRVIVKRDGDETEIGSIGIQNLSGGHAGWRWGIDTVVPMRDIDSEGEGRDRADCMRQFKAAWQRFSDDAERLAVFMAEKRKSRRWNKAT
jgi:hypothetical protein